MPGTEVNRLRLRLTSCSFEWADSIEVKVVYRSVEGANGTDSLGSHRLKRPSGLDFSKFGQCQAIFRLKYCNSMLGFHVKGIDRMKLLKLRVSHNVPLAISWLRFISTTWIILQPGQHNCMWLCSRPELPWGVLGAGPCSPGAMGSNLVWSDKVFFFEIYCRLGMWDDF